MKYLKLYEDFQSDLVVYHGSENKFATFKAGEPIFFVDDINVAKTYGPNIIKAVLELDNPIVFDFEGKSTIFFYDKYYLPSELAKFLKSISDDMKRSISIDDELIEEMGYQDYNPLYGDLDGIIMKNINDTYGEIFSDSIATNYVVFSPTQIRVLSPMEDSKSKYMINVCDGNWEKCLDNYSKQLEPLGVQLDLSIDDNIVEVMMIEVDHSLSGKGIGSLIMNELINLSDKFKFILTLKPAGGSRISRKKLMAWYTKLGFIENKGVNKKDDERLLLFYRMPK
jgi:hypothetical protein